MPLPKKNDHQSDFISRCMSSKKSKKSFPDQNQRVAFCNSQWENKGKSSGAVFVYEDPKTRELFHFSRKGVYKKNGRTLIFVKKSKGDSLNGINKESDRSSMHILNEAGGSESINSIVYEGQPTDKQRKIMERESPLVTIDWNSILPDFPLNTSDITKMDLQEVERVTRNLSKQDVDFILMADEDPVHWCEPCLKKLGLTYPKDLIDSIIKEIDPILLNLKYKFRRARPAQVAPHLGYVISVIETTTHQTPAYPSGHQVQASIAAEILCSLYPEHSSMFYKLASTIGYARVMQGVHYPSDNEAGMILARVLWENIRTNLKDFKDNDN